MADVELSAAFTASNGRGGIPRRLERAVATRCIARGTWQVGQRVPARPEPVDHRLRRSRLHQHVNEVRQILPYLFGFQGTPGVFFPLGPGSMAQPLQRRAHLGSALNYLPLSLRIRPAVRDAGIPRWSAQK